MDTDEKSFLTRIPLISANSIGDNSCNSRQSPLHPCPSVVEQRFQVEMRQPGIWLEILPISWFPGFLMQKAPWPPVQK
jgi:hypothetical protein